MTGVRPWCGTSDPAEHGAPSSSDFSTAEETTSTKRGKWQN